MASRIPTPKRKGIEPTKSEAVQRHAERSWIHLPSVGSITYHTNKSSLDLLKLAAKATPIGLGITAANIIKDKVINPSPNQNPTPTPDYQAGLSVTGSAPKSANVKAVNIEPATVMEKSTRQNIKPKYNLQYPLNEDAKLTPWIVITAFKYVYDKNDIPGNRRILDSELSTQIKQLYTIKLPLPGNMPSKFDSNWTNYTSVWSKIIRASNATEGEQFDVEQFKQRIAALSGTGALEDAVKVGAMSSLSSFITGTGLGGSIGTGVGDALTYLKVAGGISINPMSQASYTGHSIRSHSFDFNLVPRNAHEQRQVAQIIESLEDSIHGEKMTELGGILMDFPDIFNIRFTAPDGTPINGVIEIPDCYIESLNIVRSTNTRSFQITRDYYPISYTVQITFKEMQNMIRDDLKFLRQSLEQANALHSGNPIPDAYNPNLLLQDVKPFDISPSNPDSSGDTGTSNLNNVLGSNQNAPEANPGTLVDAKIHNSIVNAAQNMTTIWLQGQERGYVTQGTSEPKVTAVKDFVKIARNRNNKEHQAMVETIKSQIRQDVPGVDIGTHIDSAINAKMNQLANSYENALLERAKSTVTVGIGKASVSVEQGTIDNIKSAAKTSMKTSPAGIAINIGSKAIRVMTNTAANSGLISDETRTNINQRINIFGSK